MKSMMIAALASIAMLGCVASESASADPVKAASLHDFTIKDIDGKDVKLSKFKGKVVLVVNVASKCGLTPQYAGLQKLYDAYQKKGFVILGFPANNFGGQEPGTEADIKEFCSLNYGVTFPMFSKISVKGDDTAPLYRWLIDNSGRKDDIEWNFAKFLVGKDGQVKARFSPRTKPDAEELTKAVEAELARK